MFRADQCSYDSNVETVAQCTPGTCHQGTTLDTNYAHGQCKTTFWNHPLWFYCQPETFSFMRSFWLHFTKAALVVLSCTLCFTTLSKKNNKLFGVMDWPKALGETELSHEKEVVMFSDQDSDYLTNERKFKPLLQMIILWIAFKQIQKVHSKPECTYPHVFFATCICLVQYSHFGIQITVPQCHFPHLPVYHCL